MNEKVEVDKDNKSKFQKEYKAKVDKYKVIDDKELVELCKTLLEKADPDDMRKISHKIPVGILKWMDKKEYITTKQKNALAAFAAKNSE